MTCESFPVAGSQAHTHKKFCSQMSENVTYDDLIFSVIKKDKVVQVEMMEMEMEME